MVLGIILLLIAVFIFLKYRLYTVIRHSSVYKSKGSRKTDLSSTGLVQNPQEIAVKKIRVSEDDETKILKDGDGETLKLKDGTDLMEQRHKNFVLTKESIFNAGKEKDEK